MLAANELMNSLPISTDQRVLYTLADESHLCNFAKRWEAVRAVVQVVRPLGDAVLSMPVGRGPKPREAPGHHLEEGPAAFGEFCPCHHASARGFSRKRSWSYKSIGPLTPTHAPIQTIPSKKLEWCLIVDTAYI